jgi:hypothetical protein
MACEEEAMTAEPEALLEREVARLEALPYASLLDRLTEVRRGWLTGRSRRVSRAVEVFEVGPTGMYEIELWGIVEQVGGDSRDALHVFVSLLGNDPRDNWVEMSRDFLVEEP